MTDQYLSNSHRKLLRAAIITEALHIILFIGIFLFAVVMATLTEGAQAEGYILLLTVSLPLVLLAFFLSIMLFIHLRHYTRLNKADVTTAKAQDYFTNHLIYGIIIGFMFALFLIGILYIISYFQGKQALRN